MSLQSIHVLLPKKDLDLLKRQSSRENKSVAELIRRAVHQSYGKTDPDKKRESFKFLSGQDDLAVEDWDRIKKDLLKRHG